MFPRNRIRPGGGGVRQAEAPPPPPDTDRDVSFLDSLDFADRLAGTLGPVQTQDSLDFSDVIDADELVLGDSFDMSDFLRAITDMAFADSLALNDALSGTLGPIRAPDTLDFADTFIADELTLQDSADISDTPRAPVLTAHDEESFDISDRLGPLFQMEDDSLGLQDSFGPVDNLDVRDSVEFSDAWGPIDNLDVMDSLDFADARTAGLVSTEQFDSIDLVDALRAASQRAADSIAFTDNMDAALSNANLWANAVVTNTGPLLNPANMTDTNTATFAGITVASTPGTLGLTHTSNTVNIDFVVGFADLIANLTDFTITSVRLQYGFATDETPSTAPSPAPSRSVAIQYSLNNGAGYTTQETVTTSTNGALTERDIDLTGIADNWTEINQFRFRCNGSVTSGGGTGTASNSTFAIYYARVVITANRTFP